MIRGLDTSVKRLRKQVFTEVARVAWESDNINEDIEAIPYKITPATCRFTVRASGGNAQSAQSVCVWRWA